MVDKIQMLKASNLGYRPLKGGKRLGKKCGYDIYLADAASWSNRYPVKEILMIDSKKKPKTRRGEAVYRTVASLDLSKQYGAWHVDSVQVDSRYKGKKLSIRLYCFLLKTLGITIMAGTSQSIGGRYIWNSLVKQRGVVVFAKKSPYSKVIGFPNAGNKELVCKNFDLYDSDAVLYAVAS
ncbi:hypothetical protein CMI47_08285 [Candidatus Pacearchaeota archaeon]|jgi:hypothetical protein|nr:hypothetical protein [Candidatus Pacearchaeota archaeon]|tara:strand:+ start:313 stop:852 length:540 start_codon:yes stop_codon:yes gene_type:complete